MRARSAMLRNLEPEGVLREEKRNKSMETYHTRGELTTTGRKLSVSAYHTTPEGFRVEFSPTK